MNSRDRVDKKISFMFSASNITWHIIMKARITITAFDQDKNEVKGKRKQETEPDSNLTRTGLDSYNEQTPPNVHKAPRTQLLIIPVFGYITALIGSISAMLRVNEMFCTIPSFCEKHVLRL